VLAIDLKLLSAPVNSTVWRTVMEYRLGYGEDDIAATHTQKARTVQPFDDRAAESARQADE
jgi:hypothetical protein